MSVEDQRQLQRPWCSLLELTEERRAGRSWAGEEG